MDPAILVRAKAGRFVRFQGVDLVDLMRVILVPSIANSLIVDRPVHYERVRNASNVYRENDTHQIELK